MPSWEHDGLMPAGMEREHAVIGAIGTRFEAGSGIVPGNIVTGRAMVVPVYNLHFSGETIATPRHCLDVRLPTTVVTHCFACGMYAGIDRGFRNNAALPNNCDQFIPADEAVMILDKMA